MLESVHDFRDNLKEKMGCGLYIALDKPETVIARLLEGADEGTVIVHKEAIYEESAIEKLVEEGIQGNKSAPNKFRLIRVDGGKTLHHPDDLPYDSSSFSTLSDTFTHYRNNVEKGKAGIPVRPLLEYATHLGSQYKCCSASASEGTAGDVTSSNVGYSYLPSLQELGFTAEEVEVFTHRQSMQSAATHGGSSTAGSAVMEFRGGESAAQERVQQWMFTDDNLKDYFDIRNGMLGEAYSSKLSPWLALGCISARQVYYASKKYEQERSIINKSTYWITFELLWRDYFRWLSIKYGRAMFYPYGNSKAQKQHQGSVKGKGETGGNRGKRSHSEAQHRRTQWNTDEEKIRRWKSGTTGQPLVDANMRELLHTGWMSNRGRQNVASYLVHDLGVDWRVGADHFESLLLDHDVCSNYGNWFAAAGLTVGRINKFNCVKQSHDYDRAGNYIRHWLPELANVPAPQVFQPHLLSINDQQRYGVQIGVDYPVPEFGGFATNWGKESTHITSTAAADEAAAVGEQITTTTMPLASSRNNSRRRRRSGSKPNISRVQHPY